MTSKLDITMSNLNKNGISTFHVAKKSEVIPLLKQLMTKGDTIGVGGSATLSECGVIEFLRNGDYLFFDRYDSELTSAGLQDVFLKSNSADVYLCSSNAITEKGELYNVDGRSNRVSAIAHGPKSVILVVSVNKIVKNLEEAVFRVKTIAAPKNCQRLNSNTYCKDKGKCMSLLKDNTGMADGCDSPDRICCNYLVSAKQRQNGRIKVIFIDEEAGF